MADFARNAPGFDWAAYFREAGVADQPNLLVAQPSAFTGTARLIGETPQAVLNDYLLVRTLDATAPYLSQNFVDAHFAFHGTVLNGTPQNEPRWKRGVSLVTGAIPDDLSRHLRPALFPARGEARRRRARPQRHRRDGPPPADTSPGWRPRPAQRARAKLRAFTPKIGYPDFWHDYSSIRDQPRPTSSRTS